MPNFKTILMVTLLTTSALTSVSAEEAYKGFQSGDMLLRGRALTVFPLVTSTVSTIGGNVDATASEVPEVDLSYFFTPSVSIEGIAAITRHHVSDKGTSLGNVDLGRVSLLPPTVTAQYHFTPEKSLSPYLGAGLNYTVFFDHKLPAGGPVQSIQYTNSFGVAIQAGADYHIEGNWYANIDVKHIFINTRAKLNGGSIVGDVNLDPTILGIGLGYKF